MLQRKKVAVRDIKRGDEFEDAWVATSDAKVLPTEDTDGTPSELCMIQVQFVKDGGMDKRLWSDPAFELSIRRPIGDAHHD